MKVGCTCFAPGPSRTAGGARHVANGGSNCAEGEAASIWFYRSFSFRAPRLVSSRVCPCVLLERDGRCLLARLLLLGRTPGAGGGSPVVSSGIPRHVHEVLAIHYLESRLFEPALHHFSECVACTTDEVSADARASERAIEWCLDNDRRRVEERSHRRAADPPRPLDEAFERRHVEVLPPLWSLKQELGIQKTTDILGPGLCRESC